MSCSFLLPHMKILHITWFNDIASTDETVAVPITTIAANTKPFIKYFI